MIDVDNRDLLNLFSNLSSKRLTTVLKGALRKGSLILLKETRTLIRASGFNLTRKRKWKDGSTTTLSLGVWFTISRKAEGSTIHINFSRRRKKGDPRLNWLERGTEIRRTNAGYNRGKIEDGKYFFKRALSNKEREIFSNMNRLISESIQKIARK